MSVGRTILSQLLSGLNHGCNQNKKDLSCFINLDNSSLATTQRPARRQARRNDLFLNDLCQYSEIGLN